MKIGLVRRGYSGSGGAESYLFRLADALEQAGHACALFGSPEWPRERWPAPREFHPVAGRTPRAFADALDAIEPGRRCDLVFSLERVWTCDCYRAGDGVHAAWLERRGAVEPAWRTFLHRWNPKHRQILALERALFGADAARRIIANSGLVRDEILQRYPGFPAGRVAVVQNGLPESAFRPASPEKRAAARATYNLRADEFVILFAGTGWVRKGLGHALRAVARLPDRVRPRLLVAGRGRPAGFLRASPAGAAARCTFLGPVHDMAAPYAAADVFVLPTVYDPFSNACLEALASGLPVLTSDANGFGEVLTPGVDGEIIPTTDAPRGEELAARLLAWADRERLEAARPLCVRKAAPFTMERNVRRTLELLGAV